MYADNKIHIIMTDKITVRSGEESAYVGFQILPKTDRQGFWISNSPFLSVSIKETDKDENLRVLLIKGINDGNEPEQGTVTVTLDDGEMAECAVTVLPKLLPAPEFKSGPEIVFRDGQAVVEYTLEDIGDNVDESDIEWYRVEKKYCRKLAESRDGKPCRELVLTSADIGKKIKVYLRQKHSNSIKGPGVEVLSKVVSPENVDSKCVCLDVETVPIHCNNHMDKGYFTVRGNLICENKTLFTASMGCGIYYNHEAEMGDMTLDVILEPECITGNGFAETHQYEELYIKFDPESGNGYGLRIEGTASDDGNVNFCLYQYKNGNGTPISEAYMSNAFRPGCSIQLRAKGEVLNAFITYDDGDSFSDVEIRAKIRENTFGGFGFMHMAETTEGYRGCLKHMKAIYED